MLDGVRYAAYNLVAFAAVLFVLPNLKTRREAVTSGAIAGAVSILPGVLVFIAMLARFPGIETEAVPVVVLLGSLNAVWLAAAFQTLSGIMLASRRVRIASLSVEALTRSQWQPRPMIKSMSSGARCSGP